MEKYDDGGTAYPPNPGWRDNDPTAQGMSLLDHFAGLAMQSLMSLVVGEDTYTPILTEEDMRMVPEEDASKGVGYFYYRTSSGNWECLGNRPSGNSPYDYDPTPHVCVTTHEQRLARDAYKKAEAMIREKRRREAADE